MATDVEITLQHWKADLSIRIQRLRLRAELVGVDDAEIEALAAEADEFSRVVKIIAGLAKAAA